MDIEKYRDIPQSPISTTSGLTSIGQITDTTDNDIFYFQDFTPKEEKRARVSFPIYIEQREEKKKIFKFEWEGGLSELKDRFSSVELQKKSLDLR